VNGPQPHPDELTPAEQRLREHLKLLRDDAPQAPRAVVSRVVRSARWQRAIRQPLLAIGALAGAIGHALRLLFKPPAGHP
jgi:hypothetical protein